MSTRGQRLYDRWSRHWSAFEALYGLVFLGRGAELRRRTVEALSLEAGDAVLDFGCGPGRSFPALREAVGASGRVVGVDYSAGMVRRAADRVRAAGWENVGVLRADAARLPVRPGAFDAVHASMSISAMPSPADALASARTALAPGGRIAVLDARPFPSFPPAALNPLLVPLFERLTNWHPEVDPLEALRGEFSTVSVTEYNAGSLFVAAGRVPE